jgi:hypothetical protein
VIDHRALPAELEMRMLVRAAVTPATPYLRLLLTDAEHHHPRPPCPPGGAEVLAGDLLLAVLVLEPNHRDPAVARVAFDRVDVPPADLAQQRRRGDREPLIEQKPDHLSLRLQPRHVPVQEHPIDRAHPQTHVLGE